MKTGGFVKVMIPIVLFIAGLSPQRSAADHPIADNPESFLKAHKIRITEDSVAAALRNDDPQIRQSAADVLVKRWPRRAVPAIEAAVPTESDELVRIRMASFIAKIGSDFGRATLRSECNNTANWGTSRVLATEKLMEIADYSCMDTILQLIESRSDPRDTYSKSRAIELVPSILPHLSQVKPERVYEFLEIALEDPAGSVRLVASRMLGQLNVVEAIPSLEAALAKEQDPTIKDIMTTELARLEKKQ